MDTIRWGIAGTGRIAETFAADLAVAEGAELVTVGSRDAGRAQDFADRHGGGTGLTYADLITRDDVDVIYIATPHPQHHELALAAVQAGRGVLVEKAFTATLAGARQVIAAARETGTFCMEAMWTRFQPVVVELRRLVEAGELGDVRRVEADLGAFRSFDPADRLFDPALGGGALLDLGVYPVSFAQDFLGEVTSVHAVGDLYPNGVDSEFSAVLGFAGGRSAVVSGGFVAPSPGRAVVVGTDGWAEVLPRFHHPTRMVVQPRDGEARTVDLEPVGAGYAEEILHVGECLRQGLTESPVMSLDDTLTVMGVLSQACAQLGVAYEEAAGNL
ncbi:Gfo/Idh/MocA family oxidoreductase [Mariniluteicoccus endophyticus]